MRVQITTTTSLIPFWRPPSRKGIIHTIELSMKNVRIFCSLHSHYSILMKRYQRLQSNRAERNVEFVLAPQHETSYDSETTMKEDFDYLR